MVQKKIDRALNIASKRLYEGTIATYIPELAKADPGVPVAYGNVTGR